MNMTIRRSTGECGMVLIGVLLLLMTMSALCAALAISGNTETYIARNQQSAVEARAAADAGLSHAVALTITNLQAWQTNGFASANLAITGLLDGPDNIAGNADDGSLEGLGGTPAMPRPPATLTLAPGITYEARVFDEDDPTRGVTLSAGDITRILENSNAVSDANTRLIVRAIGYASDDAVTTVEATIGPVELPAVVTNQNVTVNGNVTIAGTEGGVHSNANLALTGTAVSIAQDATASGTYSYTGTPVVGGSTGSGYTNMTIPAVSASDHLAKADFILNDDGTVRTTQTGPPLCDASGTANACEAGYGWTYDGGGNWRIQTNGAVPAATFYVEGDATISQSPPLLTVSIIAEGSIDISGGNHTFDPDSPGLLFVTNGDLQITGNVTATAEEAQVLIREQVSLGGTTSISGQILAEGAASVETLVTANSISGTVTITYNGTAGNNFFTVTGWRRVQ